MCKCGCGTYETKITGPLLTESKVKSLLSEGLNHHISNAIPLHETVYRYGSVKHLSLIKEARKLYSRNVIDLNEFDTELVKTHLGEWGIFEGESVPLDLPMSEAYSGFLRNPEDPDSEKFEPTLPVAQFKEDLRALFGKFKGDLKNPEFIKGVAQIMVNWKSLLRSQMDEADVDEASMSGAAGAYNTPYAFVRKKLKKGKKKKGVKMNKPSGLVNYMDYSVNEGNEEAITYFQQAIKLSHTNKVRNLILKAAKELGLEIPKVWTETVNENNKNPGATLGPGPKASENGVADNAYVKQFKYKLVKKNKDGTYVQPPSTLPVRKLWGE